MHKEQVKGHSVVRTVISIFRLVVEAVFGRKRPELPPAPKPVADLAHFKDLMVQVEWTQGGAKVWVMDTRKRGLTKASWDANRLELSGLPVGTPAEFSSALEIYLAERSVITFQA